MILRGDDFLVPGPEAGDQPERVGFYIVRTSVADDLATAGKLALFDFETELRVSQKIDRCFLELGSLAIEETRPLADDEEDVASGFIFYSMT
ncbi:hypothetical protein [Pelagibius marinus]|uniref:hypothetical protein n=1 Tax=Pelagibius marinus TaxID=2762760 RepID=UPI001872E9A7|nr:hypothetical protein [Pelagibius marinus]